MTGRVYLLRLPWPSGVLAGHAKGKHWAPRARATKQLREAADWEANARGLHREHWPNARIVLAYHPPTGRGGRPDVQNMPGRTKPLIDGIADAMGCDDRGFRVAYPEQFSEPVEGGCILAEVSE